MLCDTCGARCALNRRQESRDGFRWRCRPCRYVKSVRSGSFFEGSHLSFRELVFLSYWWAQDTLQDVVMRELDLWKHTVIDWYSFHRDLAIQDIVNNPPQLGGVDDNGEPVIVEIDKSISTASIIAAPGMKDTGCSGPSSETLADAGSRLAALLSWIAFGLLVFQIPNLGFLLFVQEDPDRTAATLVALITEWIPPGTRIISDGWAAYGQLENIGDGIYLHDVVVHDDHFVDPDDRTIHTNNVENMWMCAKHQLKRNFGTSRELFPAYLCEFVRRQRVRQEEHTFGSLLHSIRQQYPV